MRSLEFEHGREHKAKKKYYDIYETGQTAPFNNLIFDTQIWLKNNAETCSSQSVQKDLQALAYNIDYLEPDTIDEFAAVQSQWNYKRIKDQDHKSAQYSDVMARASIFLAVSNICNRLDAVTETAVRPIGSRNPDGVAGDLLERIIRKGKATEIDGQRVTFSQMLNHIRGAIHFFKLDDSINFDQTMHLIQNAQMQGMDLLSRFLSIGDSYSIEEAVQYRKNTVGRYYRLLGRIVSPESFIANMFALLFNEAQVEDDIIDIYEDVKTQVNPFVAALNKTDLTQHYIQFTEKYKRSAGTRIRLRVDNVVKKGTSMVDTMLSFEPVRQFMTKYPESIKPFDHAIGLWLGIYKNMLQEKLKLPIPSENPYILQ